MTKLGTSSFRKKYSEDDGKAGAVKADDHVPSEKLEQTLADTPHVGKLFELTKSLDQLRAVLTFLEACADRDENSNGSKSLASSTPLADALESGKSTILSITAPRGKGKFAALGLYLAGAISVALNYKVVTDPGKPAFSCIIHFPFHHRRLIMPGTTH